MARKTFLSQDWLDLFLKVDGWFSRSCDGTLSDQAGGNDRYRKRKPMLHFGADFVEQWPHWRLVIPESDAAQKAGISVHSDGVILTYNRWFSNENGAILDKQCFERKSRKFRLFCRLVV
ncbi:hypothetical protein [Rhodopirellula sp. MGV]|uniref:hypothetical protein n=1 Tax=Rhodopirellula sp. MGV TaxID=2023130 RepID=UPI001E32DF4B|nr:hypothetical protein [Rhodopirellula sp. MGV]